MAMPGCSFEKAFQLMPFISVIEFLVVAAAVLVMLAIWHQRKASRQEERLAAAFERAQASREYGCGQQGNALIRKDA